MLRFFRQIRQRLLTDNKFSKYLLYAVGEILLVVIGILIALQVSNWSQNNTDRQLEKEYLERLVLDLDKDLAIVERVERFLARKDVSLKKVREFINDPNVMLVDSVMSILMESAILGSELPNVRLTGTVQEIISSGHLRLIRNSTLRNEIVSYYAFWEHNHIRIEKKESEYPSLVLQISDQGGIFKENPLYKGISFREVLKQLEIEALFYRNFMEEANRMVFVAARMEANKKLVQSTKASILEELNRSE